MSFIITIRVAKYVNCIKLIKIEIIFMLANEELDVKSEYAHNDEFVNINSKFYQKNSHQI